MQKDNEVTLLSSTVDRLAQCLIRLLAMEAMEAMEVMEAMEAMDLQENDEELAMLAAIEESRMMAGMKPCDTCKTWTRSPIRSPTYKDLSLIHI